MADKIDAVRARIAYLTKRIRRGRKQAAYARGRITHFTKVGKQAVADWRKAEAAGKRGAMALAKARARRAARKRAYWREVLDDIEDGQEKAVARRKRQWKKLRILKAQVAEEVGGDHVVTFDGKPCADWLAEDFAEARRRGLWSGYLVSGVRTSERSVELCYGICGAPSCPGLCAGVASNHNCDNCAYPRGAGDVTDYYRCESASAILDLRYTNDLAGDRVHMSANGH